MRPSFYRALFVTMVFVQLIVLLAPDVNILRSKYRYQEREEAMQAWVKEKTPESTATWKREIRLLKKHENLKGLLIGACVVAFDVGAIYLYRKYEYKLVRARK